MSSKRKSPQDSGGEAKKYRMLRNGEIIKPGDQWKCPGYGWRLVEYSVGEPYNFSGGEHYQTRRLVREVKPPVKAGAKGKRVPPSAGATRRKKGGK